MKGCVALDKQYTKKEYNCLLKLRRKPRTWAYLKAFANVETGDLNIMLSRMHNLYYVIDDASITTGLIKLNQQGETVAQAEFDRRFDMYYTRIMSLAALFVSIAAIIVSVT